ncbi:DUF2484 family protein [Palleronia sp. KMU-117]|uniref:DUF2484 family protein n=1 Tax=Palleronia sp. KMU-117 TaxID=3434108 RepID=UPI003D73FEBF
MSLSLTLGCLWVIASAITAMLPMRLQYAPGVVLLLAAPVLLILLGIEHGLLWAGIGLFAFVSMFRNPLIYLGKKALGLPVPPPPGSEDRA